MDSGPVAGALSGATLVVAGAVVVAAGMEAGIVRAGTGAPPFGPRRMERSGSGSLGWRMPSMVGSPLVEVCLSQPGTAARAIIAARGTARRKGIAIGDSCLGLPRHNAVSVK
jgi:hypothetical protein